MRTTKRLLKAALPGRLYHLLRRASYPIRRHGIRASWPFIDLADRMRLAGGDSPPYPPARLRYRVHGNPSLESFVGVGERCLEDLEGALLACGRPAGSFTSILDFGCGCGRLLIPLLARYPGVRVFGTDTDAEAIAWDRDHLPDCPVAVNAPLPPLEYPGDHFDLVYAISVFTHLDEAFQFRWLEELNRVLKPGGLLLLTVSGEAVWKNLAGLDAQHRAALAANRHVFLKTEVIGEKGYPEWYQSAFHTEEYVRAAFSRVFTVLKQFPQGMANYQDLVVLRKEE